MTKENSNSQSAEEMVRAAQEAAVRQQWNRLRRCSETCLDFR